MAGFLQYAWIEENQKDQLIDSGESQQQLDTFLTFYPQRCNIIHCFNESEAKHIIYIYFLNGNGAV